MLASPVFRLSLFAAAAAVASLAAPSVLAAPGDKVGPEFRVNTTVSGHQAQPDIALSANGDYAVAWADSSALRGSHGGHLNIGQIFVRRYRANGTAKDAAPLPVVPSDFLTRCELDPECFDEPGGPLSPAIAMAEDGDFVVTWRLSYYSVYEVYSRRYTAAGQALDPVPVDLGIPSWRAEQSVAMDAEGDFFVVASSYYTRHDGPDSSYCGGTYASGYGPAGQRFRNMQVSDQACSEHTITAMEPGGDFVVAFDATQYDCSEFSQTPGDCVSYVGVRRYRSDGTSKDSADIRVVEAPFPRDDQPTRAGFVSDIAVDAVGDFIVTWSTYEEHSRVVMRRYFANGTPKGPATQVNAVGSGIHRNAKLGIASDGSFTVAWERLSTARDNSEIFWRSFNRNGLPTKDVHLRANTFTAGYQSRPAIAVNANGAFTVAWQSDGQDGSGVGVYAQRFEGSPAPPPPLPTVSFAQSALAVDEAVGMVKVRVTLSAATTKPVTVPFSVGGTATQNADYKLASTSVVIPAGSTFANFNIKVIDDKKREPRETLIVSMGVPVNAKKGAVSAFELAIKKSD